MWLARDVRGLTLFSDRPVKQKIVIENEGVKRAINLKKSCDEYLARKGIN